MRAEDYFNLALASRDPNEQIENYGEAIQLDPDFAPAYNNRGVAYTALGQFGLAVVDYTFAIQLQPDYAAPYFGRGLAYLEIPTDIHTNRPKFAFVEFVTEHLRDPARKTGYQHAIADFSQAIQLKPEMTHAYLYRGIAYHRLREYMHAVVDYTQAIWHDPNSSECYANRSLAYAAQRRFHDALQDANHFLITYSDHPICERIRPLAELWRKNLSESASDSSKQA